MIDMRDQRACLVAVRGVTKTYQLGGYPVIALSQVSFDIGAGEFIAITGPSGSGKSTLMHLLGTLDVPSGGNLQIAGADTRQLSSDALADLRSRKIGFVFQNFNLLPRLSALQQVMLPLTYAMPRPAQTEAIARRMLEQVGLGDRVHHKPLQLSGGQQQRVAIARALVNEPKLLLADEPTGALDTRTSDEVMALFARLNQQGITIVVVTHDRDVARYAGRQIVMRDGIVVSDSGAPQTVGRPVMLERLA